ncbi:MAG: ATPase, partial [Cyclobacteriaceae bacterium]|nr:ATPase [Cyclobacteriaceae bacterium]
MIFFQASLQQIFSFLDSSSLGLDEKEAQNRYKEARPNELRETKKQGVWLLVLDQFKDVMILILAGAALLSSWIGDQTDTYIILVILLLNAFLGFIQEYRAEKAIATLKKLSETQSQVLRSGKQVCIPSRQLVMGDVVILEAGNLVPADLRFLETYSLKIDESSLTGESIPSEKVCKVLDSSSLSLGDQVNMGFKGTLVTQGRAKGMVVAIGMDTQMGKIAQLLEQRSPMTPLQRRMQAFGKVISLVILGICAAVFLAGLARGEEIFSMLLLSVSLAVAAIPEALPALITIALSLGAKKLAKQNALVRKLPAVESLGSITYLCTDKTGTITQNKLSVSRWESASQARIMEN